MLGHFIQFQCFHMRQRLRVGNSRDRLDDRVRASADDDVGSAKLSPRPIRKRDFQSSRTNEASDAEDQLRAAALEILQVHLVQAPHHSAFARQHRRHVNRRTRLCDSAAFRSAKVGRNLCAVDDVFARKARDVRARSADEFSLDDGDTLSVAGKRPRSERRSRPVPEDNQIVLFRLRLLRYLSG